MPARRRRPGRRRLLPAAAVLGALLATSCDSSPGAVLDPAPGGRAVTGRQVHRAEQQLAELPVTGRGGAGPAYHRDAFGTAWADTDHNGCNQRDDVLLRDAVPGTVTVGRQGACDHDVLAGTWIDPYTGRRLVLDDLKDLSQAQAIQIDHIVPLGEAWVSGASGWDDDRREAFANDLRELIAVDGPTNAAKSDDDPAAWRPRRAFQCAYAVRWVTTKWRWHLRIDVSEKRALEEMLGYC